MKIGMPSAMVSPALSRWFSRMVLNRYVIAAVPPSTANRSNSPMNGWLPIISLRMYWPTTTSDSFSMRSGTG
ncbi:hypothetical protein D3C81_2192260 [compost metagenome]